MSGPAGRPAVSQSRRAEAVYENSARSTAYRRPCGLLVPGGVPGHQPEPPGRDEDEPGDAPGRGEGVEQRPHPRVPGPVAEPVEEGAGVGPGGSGGSEVAGVGGGAGGIGVGAQDLGVGVEPGQGDEVDLAAAGDDQGVADGAGSGGDEVDQGVAAERAQGPAGLLAVRRVEEVGAGEVRRAQRVEDLVAQGAGDAGAPVGFGVRARGGGTGGGGGRLPGVGERRVTGGAEAVGYGAGAGGGVQEQAASGVQGDGGVVEGTVGQRPPGHVPGGLGGVPDDVGRVGGAGLEQRGPGVAAQRVEPGLTGARPVGGAGAGAFAQEAGEGHAEGGVEAVLGSMRRRAGRR